MIRLDLGGNSILICYFGKNSFFLSRIDELSLHA